MCNIITKVANTPHFAQNTVQQLFADHHHTFKWIALSHCSNLTGYIYQVAEMEFLDGPFSKLFGRRNCTQVFFISVWKLCLRPILRDVRNLLKQTSAECTRGQLYLTKILFLICLMRVKDRLIIFPRACKENYAEHLDGMVNCQLLQTASLMPDANSFLFVIYTFN